MRETTNDELRGEVLKEIGGLAAMIRSLTEESRDGRAATNKRLDSLELEIKKIDSRQLIVEQTVKETTRKSNQDLSDHKAAVESKDTAISLQLTAVAKSLNDRIDRVAHDNSAQTTSLVTVQQETSAQTPVLERVARHTRFGPMGLAIAGFLGTGAAHFILELLKSLGAHI